MYKFLAMLASEQLPSYALSEWNRTCKLKVGHLELQRAIINAAHMAMFWKPLW